MSYMFARTYVFNGDISNWDTSNVTNMSHMFWDADLFNNNISKWNTSKVTNMEKMFNRASYFYQNISSWIVDSVIAYSYFDKDAGFEGIEYYQPQFK